MEIEITTTDPHEISANEVIDALTAAGYFVNSITVRDRAGKIDSAIGRPMTSEARA